MVSHWADVETVGGVWCPRCLVCWVIIDEGFGLKWGKRCLVEIECPVQFLVSQNGRILSREPKEVECEFNLG